MSQIFSIAMFVLMVPFIAIAFAVGFIGAACYGGWLMGWDSFKGMTR